LQYDASHHILQKKPYQIQNFLEEMGVSVIVCINTASIFWPISVAAIVVFDFCQRQ
jgi:hypothetical protein